MITLSIGLSDIALISSTELVCLCIVTLLFDLQEATDNDIPREFYDVKGFPTLALKTASGKLVEFDGERTEEDILDFVEKNREKIGQDERDEL